VYLPNLRSEISQGDVFGHIPIVKLTFPDTTPIVRRAKAILLSDDCEFDKASSLYCIMAEMRPISEVSQNNQGTIINYKTLNTFFLEGCDAFEESYIDFRRMYQVEKKFLTEKDSKCSRYKSFTDQARLALQRQIAIFFGYQRRMATQTPPQTPPSVSEGDKSDQF
jgi:hypothetical protein